MTDDATRAQRLLAPLRERPHSVDAARAEARRARIVPQLEAHLVLHGARRQRVQRIRAVVLAVAASLFGFGVLQLLRPHPVVAQRPMEIRAVEGRLLHRVSGAEHTVLAGDRLVEPVAGELRTDGTSGASLETEAGLRLDLDANSEVSLADMAERGPDRRVELMGGQLACAVPKLAPGSTFAVVTPNAKVVVHGTKFSVRVDSSEAGVTRTCVRVREGLVAVHHAAGTAMLHAHEAWGCPESPPVTPAPAEPAKEAPQRHAFRHAAPVNPPPQAAHDGTLGRETELLQSALAAERKGRRVSAMASLTQLISGYPESPLLPEAKAALRRVAAAASETP
jgi:FecR protein